MRKLFFASLFAAFGSILAAAPAFADGWTGW
jgi:hypothetical protein